MTAPFQRYDESSWRETCACHAAEHDLYLCYEEVVRMTTEHPVQNTSVFRHESNPSPDDTAHTMPQQRVGEATVDKVFELDGLVMPVSTMFPSVTDADLETAAPWLFDPYITGQVATSGVNFSWHAYVVRFGDKTVVVATGHGNDKCPSGLHPAGLTAHGLPGKAP